MSVASQKHELVSFAEVNIGERERVTQIGITYVTGSAKRYVVALTMIFLYKRCCSKTRSIFYSLKNFFFGLEVSTTLCLHSCQI